MPVRKTIIQRSGNTGGFEAVNSNGLLLSELSALVDKSDCAPGSDPIVILCVPDVDTDTSKFERAYFDVNQPDEGPGGVLYLHVNHDVEPKLTTAFSSPPTDSTTTIYCGGKGNVYIAYGKRGGVSVNVDELLAHGKAEALEAGTIQAELASAEWDAAVRGFTAAILAMAGAGVDFEDAKIKDAVVEAVDAIANEFGDDPALPKPLGQLLRKTGSLLTVMGQDLKVPEKYSQRITDQRKAIDKVLDS
jgi:hypothetical protein